MDACGLDAIIRIELGVQRLDRAGVPVPSGFAGDPTTPEHVSARNACLPA